MDRARDRKRTNVDGDRLSSLPDDVIHKILSFIDITEAIETSVLSPRWRFIWTSLPYLNFSTDYFSTLPKFYEFVIHVLSRRSKQADVSSVGLEFSGDVTEPFVKTILNYAFSHNVQRLRIMCAHREEIEFPLSLFKSESLTHLSLTGTYFRNTDFITLASTWDLPALTTLSLESVTLLEKNTDKDNGIFSKCANLENLTLKKCHVIGEEGFTICHSRLCNLTFEDVEWYVNFVSVVARQLKNLNMKRLPDDLRISAPDLANLLLECPNPVQFSSDGFRSLEMVDLHMRIDFPKKIDAHKMVSMLQHLHSVKFLALSFEIVELLSSSVELISHQPSPFASLMGLKIYPAKTHEPKKVTMSTKLKKYFLGSSPNATLTRVSCEEKLVQNLMARLWKDLEEEAEIATIEINMARRTHKAKTHDKGKGQVETKMQLKTRGSMTQVNSCWEDLGTVIDQRQRRVSSIIWSLQRIEELLTKMPPSKRAAMKRCFYSLSAQAEIVTRKMIDCMKIKCDDSQSLLSACFPKHATPLHK